MPSSLFFQKRVHVYSKQLQRKLSQKAGPDWFKTVTAKQVQHYATS